MPSEPGGDWTTQDVGVHEPAAGTVPNMTEPPSNWVPSTVTAVPPATGPPDTASLLTVGRCATTQYDEALLHNRCIG